MNAVPREKPEARRSQQQQQQHKKTYVVALSNVRIDWEQWQQMWRLHTAETALQLDEMNASKP